jgi:hypothetical protein
MRYHVYPLLAVIFGLLAITIEPAGAARLTEDCGCVDPVDGAVQDLFAAYPQGGPELAAAIDDLLQSNPELAQDVICASHGASEAQQSSAAAGYAHAQLVLASADPQNAGAMAEDVRCSEQEFRSAYYGTQNAYAFLFPGGPVNPFIPRLFGAGFGGGVVSLNEPFTE